MLRERSVGPSKLGLRTNMQCIKTYVYLFTGLEHFANYQGISEPRSVVFVNITNAKVSTQLDLLLDFSRRISVKL